MSNRRFVQAGRVVLAVAAVWFTSLATAGDDAKGTFTINQGISGAWFNAETAGQGFLIDVEPESQFIFVAWFTFDESSSKVGAAGQRWLTAQGQYSGGSAELPLFVTSGGVFDDPQGVDTQQDGSLSISFSDCSNGSIAYDLASDGLQGEIAITRVIPGTQDLCENAGAKLAGKGDASFFMPTAGPTGGDVFRMHRHSNGDIFLGGFVSGRLYRSSDNGLNWSPSTFTSPPFNWIDGFASGPDGALYIANACGFSQCDAEAGVYRSTDGGDTFELLGLNNLEVTAVFAGDGVILAATAGNVGTIRRSTNGGTSFVQALGGIELVRGFAQSPAGTIFAAEAQGIYRSTNNGGAWTRTLDLPCCSDTAVVVDADGVVFASHFDGVFRSTDDGLTWSAADSGIPRTDGARRIVQLAVDDDGDLAVARFDGGGVYVSSNDGNSWQQIGDSQVADSIFVTALIYANNGTLLYAADQTGVLRTDDNGNNWSRSNEGLRDTSVGELQVAGNGDLYATAGGELHRTRDRGASWERLQPPIPLGFFGGAYALGPNDEIYAGSGGDGSLVVSTDEGQSWTNLNPPWQGEEDSGVTFIASNADGDLFVTVFDNFAGNGDQSGIYRSTDGGASFVSVNNGLPARDANFSDAPGPNRIGIAPDGTLLVSLEMFNPATGNFTAPIYRSTDNGDSWTDTGTSTGEFVGDFAFAADGRIYAATQAGLFRSGDGGVTFNSLNNNLPGDGEVLAVATTPEGGLYASSLETNPNTFEPTSRNVYFSTDRGATWSEVSDGLPEPFQRNAVLSLAVADGYLYAGTRTSSVYRTAEAISAVSFGIDQSLFGAWFDPTTPGQGFLFDIEPTSQFFFLAWFTYESATTKVGAPEQRWLTAQGSYEGTSAPLQVFTTSGGVFDDPQAPTTEASGSLSIDFEDCSNATLTYDLSDEGLQGQIPITRVIPGTEALCEGN